MRPIVRLSTFATAAALALGSGLLACGGDPVGEIGGTATTPGGCTGSCVTAASSLTVTDVQKVIAQAVGEAQARNTKATIAVVDRVGNVLAVFRMGNAADRSVTIATRTDSAGNAVVNGGLEGIRLPVPVAPVNIDDQAAIAKAITGAYLSSEGNAFSTRTASQIVQEHFNPGEANQPSGPLFGVQFSQLACSDFMRGGVTAAAQAGPRRSPLGLSADPGGFPLYKDGTVIGGVGAIADGSYSIDSNIADTDNSADEAIAFAGTYGFSAPLDVRADRITLDGKTARFSDVDLPQLASQPAAAQAAYASITPATGALVIVNGYFNGAIRAGSVFGQAASGIRADTENNFPGRDAFVFVDDANALRFPPRAGLDGAAALTQPEVLTTLRSALDVANRARAQIRRPVGSQARVTISVVDTQGNVLGMVRTRDAPVFGADVSLQKARTAAFFSKPGAATFVQGLPAAKYLAISNTAVGLARSVSLGSYVTASRAFTGEAQLFGDGRVAWSARAISGIARPLYPDGIDSAPAGPLSKVAGEWSVFSSGLQLDIAINAILQHVLFVAGVMPTDVVPGCAGVDLTGLTTATATAAASAAVANGLQIFPGGVPIYRGETLVGAIGVSGDGVDQDDMISFLGLSEAGTALAGSIGNAPAARRADTLLPQGVRLRYVQCPQSPYVNSTAENVCASK